MGESLLSALMNPRPRGSDRRISASHLDLEDAVLNHRTFARMLYVERKRAERTNGRFVVMIVESKGLFEAGADERTIETMLLAISRCTRETDVKGWHKENQSVGVILTDIGAADPSAVAAALLGRTDAAFRAVLAADQVDAINVSFHLFPDTYGREGGIDPALYPELLTGNDERKSARMVKRAIDIGGSILGLLLLLPLMAAIAVAIKMTSNGPVIFRQVRVGLRGEKFTFLKFRTMYAGNDQTVHREYTRRLIRGSVAANSRTVNETAVYKIKDDPRVTRVGKWLRRTSLDELPQLLNVLKGEMSLVGPRPAIPYEVESYAVWHRRRLLFVKPGITGLWQINGRSRVSFDEMVRLDLRYAQSWSVAKDLCILLKTPTAVFSGNGAY